MSKVLKTREQWLNRFMVASRPMFKSIGHPIPTNVRLSVGFTSHGSKGKRIGECWSAVSSKDNTFEIFVTPLLADTPRVAGVITHELIHAAVGLDKKHGKVFKKAALALGLQGKMTATTEGPAWEKWATPILKKIGKIPHAELVSMPRAASDSQNRHIKCECGCGIVFRMSRTTIDSLDAMRCPNPECDETVVTE